MRNQRNHKEKSKETPDEHFKNTQEIQWEGDCGDNLIKKKTAKKMAQTDKTNNKNVKSNNTSDH